MLVVGGASGLEPVARCELYDPASDTWALTGDVATARTEHTATRLLDGTVLIVGGAAAYGQILSTVERYDPSTDSWSERAPLPSARAAHTATILGDGRVVVVGGRVDESGTATANSVAYDAAADAWNDIGSPAMTQPRYDHTASLLTQSGTEVVLVVGGRSENGAEPSSEELDTASASWSVGPSLSAGRYGHTATTMIAGNVLITGGAEDGGRPILDVARCALGAATCTEEADALVVARGHHTATRIGPNRVLLVGGEDSASSSTAEVYDEVSGTSRIVGSLRTRRSDHTATRMPNDTVLVTGGSDGTQALQDVERFDPLERSWNSTGSLFWRRSAHTAHGISSSDTVWIIGGSNGSMPELPLERYDATTGLWSQPLGPLPEPRSAHASVVLHSGELLVAGGQYGSAVGTSVRIDLAQPTGWVTESMIQPVAQHTATLLTDGRVLVAGGIVEHATLVAQLYDSGTWHQLVPMVAPRQQHTATLIPAPAHEVERVLMCGGLQYPLGMASDHCEVATGFEDGEPSAIEFAVAATMNDARVGHTATVLTGRRVLVVGGVSTNGTVLDRAEIYVPDELVGTWTATPPMSTARRDHAAVKLPDGRVLVAGGVGTAGPLQSAEIFDPGNDTWTDVSDMIDVRSLHTATLLPGSGQVLVVGGVGLAQETQTAELFQPLGPGGLCGARGDCEPIQFCADGVCCNAVCEGLCMSCRGSATVGAADGECGAVEPGTDPDGDCLDDGSPTCEQNGLCGSNGSCQLYSTQEGCVPEPCTSSDQCAAGLSCADGICCDSPCTDECSACTAERKEGGVDGVCEPLADGASCAAGSGYCSDGECTAKADGGAPCSGDEQCSSGHCVEGICCEQSDCGAYRCSAQSAQCLASCGTIADCATGYTCDAQGRCVPHSAAESVEACGCALPGSSSSRSGAWWLLCLVASGHRLRRRAPAGVRVN